MIDFGIMPNDRIKALKRVTPHDIREAATNYLPTNRKEGRYVISIRDPLKTK